MAEVGSACGEKGSAKPVTGDDRKTLDLYPQFVGGCCWQPWSIYAEASNTTSEWPHSSLYRNVFYQSPRFFASNTIPTSILWNELIDQLKVVGWERLGGRAEMIASNQTRAMRDQRSFHGHKRYLYISPINTIPTQRQ